MDNLPYTWIYIGAIVIIAISIVMCLIRSIRGPRIADRIVAVNMIGTMVIVTIAILAIYRNEGYLLDVCLIYATISFVSVIVLTKVYLGVYKKRQLRKSEEVQRIAAAVEEMEAEVIKEKEVSGKDKGGE